jgi:tetratricopeptide (TPR) repeat protein
LTYSTSRSSFFTLRWPPPPADHPDRPGYLSNLGIALRIRFGRTGQSADLDEAITACRDAVAGTPADHPNRPLYLSNLGIALRARFGRTGQSADLDEAIDVGREAVVTTPADHPDRPGYLSNLGNTLLIRFGRTGQSADLDEAITAFRDAVAGTPADHPNHPLYLSNLGNALRIRFERTGQSADLDEAIDVGREAVVTTPADHPNRPGRLSNLGNTLETRFERTGQLADLDEAITAFRDAVAGTPADHPNHPLYLSNLGNALRARFERTGQSADLDEAIDVGREAVVTTPADHPDRPGRLSNLGAALRIRFERTGQSADLDEAIDVGREAVVTTPADHPNRPGRLSNLGNTLETRFERTGQSADLNETITAFRDAVQVGSASPANRMRAGLRWGRAAIDAGWVDSAADGFASAVRLLPLLVWHRLPRATREQHLAEWSGLAAEAAACAIRAGRPEGAVELLEAGRSVLWAQTRNLRELTELAWRAPDLATRLDQIRTLLDTPLPTTAAETISADTSDQLDQLRARQTRAIEDRMRLGRELEDLLERVRALEGFEHFLTATPLTHLRAAVTDGPVVIINASTLGCHALLVTTTGVQVVDLPDLTHDQAIQQANTLLAILARATPPDHRPFLEREQDRHTVLDILDWLWDTVTEPILTSLGHTSPPPADTADTDWPRIWWCPTGPLTTLPLHAAGHHPRHQRPDNPATTDTVSTRVISSYTPTLTMLLRARTAPNPIGPPRLLAVGMPTTPEQPDLTAVPAELDCVCARYPMSTRLQSLSRHQLHHGEPADRATQPTTARVLAELPHHDWVHLACHGSQHITDPTASAFWLTDGPLSIADLIEQYDLRPRELAFLSACQTAAGSARVVDEAIHPAAAMQLLGYRHVIATLWSIYDSPTPKIADSVYAALTATGTPTTHHAARALHQAITALRADHPTDPLVWAPYLHTGP